MKTNDWIPTDPEACIWDVVVVGAGAGGGAAGYSLARSGRSVLFLERGKLDYREALNHQGRELNRSISGAARSGSDESGWWPHRIEREGRVGSAAQVRIGSGVGGSTTFFGMVMERFQPTDFAPIGLVRDAPEATLPEAWPIQYNELERYYEEAEQLFRVRGTDDPLDPRKGTLIRPLPPSDTESATCGMLREAGLHPYALHTACERLPGCDGCFGRRCARPCRNDAARICVIPALESHGAHILPECRVVRLDTRRRKVTQAICALGERRLKIRARVFVLALHAMLTPALLLRSANGSFPDGLGNASGMVGRNLMLHVLDSLAVRVGTLHGSLNASLNHGISLNDFYQRSGIKLGNIQAHAANVDHLLAGSEPDGAVHFFTIVEDFPYAANRVSPISGEDNGVRWTYSYPDELRFRRKLLIDAFIESLRPISGMSVQRSIGELNIPHACGTCRFGNDPSVSVLNRDNRVHELDNLYIVDGSFFPTSGGVNPSLTIIANSLRVSEIITRQ